MNRFLFNSCLIIALGGCFNKVELQKELAPKKEDGHVAEQSPASRPLLRIIGNKVPYVASYDERSGALLGVYKVMIVANGNDSWPSVKEDQRISREPRYFAVGQAEVGSQTNSTAWTKGEAIRVDIFRGHPRFSSVVARNQLLRVDQAAYLASQAKPAKGSHIIVGNKSEVHAVPLKQGDNVVSFAIVDGITPKDSTWASAELSPHATLAPSSAMGCKFNYTGIVHGDGAEPATEFIGVCDREAPAGL